MLRGTRGVELFKTPQGQSSYRGDETKNGQTVDDQCLRVFALYMSAFEYCGTDTLRKRLGIVNVGDLFFEDLDR